LEGERGNFYGSPPNCSEAKGTSAEQWLEDYDRIRQAKRQWPDYTDEEIARIARVSIAKVKAADQIYRRKRKGAKIPAHVIEEFTSVH
jgi:hypothetical protein